MYGLQFQTSKETVPYSKQRSTVWQLRYPMDDYPPTVTFRATKQAMRDHLFRIDLVQQDTQRRLYQLRGINVLTGEQEVTRPYVRPGGDAIYAFRLYVEPNEGGGLHARSQLVWETLFALPTVSPGEEEQGKTLLSEKEASNCRCVLHVAAQQPEWCLKEKAYFQQRDNVKCYNPFAVCTKTVGVPYPKGKCAEAIDFDAIPDAEVKAYALLHNMKMPQPWTREAQLGLIKEKLGNAYRGR
jgi:hypothetical protein